MRDAIRVSGPVNTDGLEMSFETGKLAQLADGAVVVRLGDTTLLSTVCTSKPREGIDFFPLTVEVEERMYAAGKIPGSFFRREGRPGEQAILTCRLTDRPLRPSFPEGFRNEVQVVATMMVEAGGTEMSWDLYDDGAPKVTEEVIAEGLEYSKQWIAASIKLQSELRRRVEEEHGKIETIEFQTHTDYDDDVFAAVE